MPRVTICLALILLTVPAARASELDVFLVGSLNGQVPRQETVFLLKEGSRLTISVVLRKEGRLYSSVDTFDGPGGRRVVSNRLPPRLSISWYMIKPKLREYSNLWRRDRPDVGDIHVEPIEYEKVLIPASADQAQMDLSPLLHALGPGTSYLSAEINGVAGTAPSPLLPTFAEPSPLHLKFPFRIIQIVYRVDDSYLGYLTELYRTPFVIGPRMTDQGVHETDARMGSDCAAFAIYGKRRQGYLVPYCGPVGIYRYLSDIADKPLRPIPFDHTEAYATQDNRLIRTGPGGLEVGDIIHFGEQVSVFYRDAGIKGLFDRDDLLLQSYGIQPTITTVKNSGFYHRPVRIFKWKDHLKRPAER